MFAKMSALQSKLLSLIRQVTCMSVLQKRLLQYLNMTDKMPVYVSDEYIKAHNLLKLDDLAAAIESAMGALSMRDGNVVQPARTLMKIPGKNGVFLSMPAYIRDDDALACKLVTSFPGNIQKGLPSVLGTVLLFDTNTGKILAILEGTEITTWRTAVASVVATKHLHKNPGVLAILGSGTQGYSHAIALNHFFHFQEIHIWNHHHEGATTLTEKLRQQGMKVKAFESIEECVKDADVIVTATYSNKPFLKLQWIKPGAHINAVGAGISHHGELEVELYKAADVYTDDMDAAEHELKGLTDQNVSILGEVGEIINGIKTPSEGKTTIFQSMGMAVEDVVSAKLIYGEYKKINQ